MALQLPSKTRHNMSANVIPCESRGSHATGVLSETDYESAAWKQADPRTEQQKTCVEQCISARSRLVISPRSPSH
jgi:hypothetical protein